jgi:hypothetical protein
VIAFTTTDGPALLRLVHQDDRTIAGLSLHLKLGFVVMPPALVVALLAITAGS